MLNNAISKAKVTRLISCDSECLTGSFVKIYCDDYKNEIMKDFVQLYNDLNEKYMSPLLDNEDLLFEEYPNKLTKKNCFVQNDGVYIDIGMICMMWYGWLTEGYVDKERILTSPLITTQQFKNDIDYEIKPFNYNCIELTIKHIIKKYGEMEYEGVVTIENGMVRVIGAEGTVSSRVIGNRKDYSYTYDKIKNDILEMMKKGRIEPLLVLNQREIFKLWDDDECIYKKNDLRDAVIEWSSFCQSENYAYFEDEIDMDIPLNDKLIDIILNNSYKSDKYMIMLMSFCVSIEPNALKRYMQNHKRKVNKLINSDAENRALLRDAISDAFEEDKLSFLQLI